MQRGAQSLLQGVCVEHVISARIPGKNLKV
ncbi:hypothetical protein PMI16_02862 [Herbaspirillum sp. CF444]|nr:hypothetical protein PMI16_02862 [Herbaspirillum sp. CF444]